VTFGSTVDAATVALPLAVFALPPPAFALSLPVLALPVASLSGLPALPSVALPRALGTLLLPLDPAGALLGVDFASLPLHATSIAATAKGHMICMPASLPRSAEVMPMSARAWAARKPF